MGYHFGCLLVTFRLILIPKHEEISVERPVKNKTVLPKKPVNKIEFSLPADFFNKTWL
jgi:hypothetical protein